MIAVPERIRPGDSPPPGSRSATSGPRVRGVALLAAGLTAVFLLAASCPAGAQTVVGTLHDLSTDVGPSIQVCVFCHTPHTANMNVVAPLWNRFVDLDQTFVPYSSLTMNTIPGQPTLTISGVCLGCHDGTSGTAIVNGNTGTTNHDLVNAPGPGGIPDTSSWPNCRRCHGPIYGDPPPRWQGTDLSDDHPISMLYPTPAIDPGFETPPDVMTGWDDIPLYDGRVECPSCHDPHDPTMEPFLRVTMADSELCVTCHVK